MVGTRSLVPSSYVSTKIGRARKDPDPVVLQGLQQLRFVEPEIMDEQLHVEANEDRPMPVGLPIVVLAHGVSEFAQQTPGGRLVRQFQDSRVALAIVAVVWLGNRSTAGG